MKSNRYKIMYQIYDNEGTELYSPFQTLDGALYMAKYYAPEGSTVVEVELLEDKTKAYYGANKSLI